MEAGSIDLHQGGAPASTSRFAAGVLAVALAVAGIAAAAAQTEAGGAPVDADGDGEISAEEHERAAKLIFQRMDANGDGRVDPGELDSALAARGTPGAARVTPQERIRLLDSDGDGLLSQQEHGSGAQRMFAQLDGNADGRVTAQEHAEARARMSRPAGD